MPPRAPRPALHLAGTTLEGGGQLLRLALCLSSLTKIPINITDIRGKRHGGGGLKAQHLTCLQWLGQACNARISGVGLKSKEVTFTPDVSMNEDSQLETGEVRIQQNTPGSVNLVLQAILPYILFSGASGPIRVRITGGTNVSNSPSCDYITHVLIPMLENIGIPHISTQIQSRGWSQGTTRVGSVTYTITPLVKKLPAFSLVERGDIRGVKAMIIAPRGTERQFREELDVMFDRRESRLFEDRSIEPDIGITFEDSHHDKRYYLLLVATTTTGMKLGRDWLYDQRVRPGELEKIIPTIVKRVSDDLLEEIDSGGCVDEYLRDQLVVFQALAEGRSRVHGGKRKDLLLQPSLHAKTAQWVAHELLGVDFNDEWSCEGVGFRPGGEQEATEEAVALVEEVERMQYRVHSLLCPNLRS